MVLAALASGCGGIDEAPAARRDAGFAGDRPSSQPDAGAVAADGPVSVPDLGVAGKDATEAGSQAAVDTGAQETGGEVGTPDATADAGARPEIPPPPPATIIVLPDTQYYSYGYPEVFAQQTSWVLDQMRTLRIQVVLHVGDLVERFNEAQEWTHASSAMRALDNVVPYVIVPGNHDTDANRQTPINTYFEPASMPWIAGTMVAGQIENSYALLDIGAQKWLILGLEFGPRDMVITWADSVLKAYPNHPAILVTHAYLFHDGSRYDINISKVTHQDFIPQDYGYTASQGINDGEMMWQKLVLPNPNVRMVFSGHDTGSARLTSARPDGSVVHQILSDYQWWTDDTHQNGSFGYGWLRIVGLDYVRKTIEFQTYSPYLQRYLTDDDNQFTLPWNL